MHFGDDVAAQGLEHGDKAGEMDHVAETLFLVQQDCLAFEFRSVPARLGEFAGRVGIQLPAPFVFGETVAQVAVLQQAQAPVPVARRMIGAKFQRLVETLKGFGGFA